MPNTPFEPMDALIGGALIGLSAVALMLFLGRIMGISGIVGGLFVGLTSQEYSWRLPFLAGVIAAPVMYQAATSVAPEITASPNTVLVAVAGVLVGFGSTLGSGCTSGHGICGLSRFSRRSLVAVAVFMTVAFVTVFVVRHVI
ncbi:MAG: YeeE/YedE family protein [Hyphomicrobiaceae bacterium]